MTNTSVGHSNDVPVLSSKDSMELQRDVGSLNNRVGQEVLSLVAQAVTDLHIRELRVVGRTGRGQRIPWLQGIRPGVGSQTSDVGVWSWDSVVDQVWVDEVVEVGVEVQTSGVLIDEGARSDRIPPGSVTLWLEGQSTIRDGGKTVIDGGRVVRPLSLHRLVSEGEVVLDNTMGQSQVGSVFGSSAHNIMSAHGLDLSHEDISWGVSHLDTLIVMDNSVVSVGVSMSEGHGR